MWDCPSSFPAALWNMNPIKRNWQKYMHYLKNLSDSLNFSMIHLLSTKKKFKTIVPLIKALTMPITLNILNSSQCLSHCDFKILKDVVNLHKVESYYFQYTEICALSLKNKCLQLISIGFLMFIWHVWKIWERAKSSQQFTFFKTLLYNLGDGLPI